MEKRYLSIKDISEYLGLSKATLYLWVEERKVPCHKIGKVIRFDINEVNKWMEGFKKEAISTYLERKL